MKRSYSVNINGISFSFDEDALMLIEKHMSKVSGFYKVSTDDAVIKEYENRIACILQERVGGNGIVTVELIDSVLNEVAAESGLAQEIFEEPKEDASNGCGEKSEMSNDDASERAWRKAMRLGAKFFRDPSDRMIGGVLSGIAKYNGWNEAVVRLIVVLLFFMTFSFGGSWLFIIVYSIIWIITPLATNVIDITRMLKPMAATMSEADVEAAWKYNYEKAAGMLASPKNNGCLAMGLKIVFLILAAIVALPLLFALGVLLFILVVMIFAAASFLGTSIFSNIYVAILLLLPLFALVHWILKKCNICSPLNIYIKSAIIIGWLAVLGCFFYKIDKKLEANGGWEALMEQCVDARFTDKTFWENLIRENLSAIESRRYAAWVDANGNLPFAVEFIQYDLEDKVLLKFHKLENWHGGNADVGSGKGDAYMELYFVENDGNVRFVWDSASDEILVNMDATTGSSMNLYSEGINMRYINDSDSITYGNAAEKGALPFEIRVFMDDTPAFYMYGNEAEDGVMLAPVAQRYICRSVLSDED